MTAGSYAARPRPSARYAEKNADEIELVDRLDHEPREMILRQPVPQRRWQQERLVPTGLDEVLGHP